MEQLHGDQTAVMIAHRHSTVSRADLVVLLDKGQVVETGTRKGLMERPQGRLRVMPEGHSGMLY